MKIPALLFSLFLGMSVTTGLRAQMGDPGAQQDAEATRERLLKATDQLDNIQANSESTKLAVDGMKSDVAKLQADVTRLQADNAALKQQVADLQTALDESKAAYDKKLKVLVDNVAGMITAGKGSSEAKPVVKKKKDTTASETTSSSLAPPPDPSSAKSTSAATSTDSDTDTSGDSTPVKSQKGYYHVVASGETLTLICNAYRQNGVNVTVSEIQKANNLTDKSLLKVGQKLFIPKPGT